MVRVSKVSEARVKVISKICMLRHIFIKDLRYGYERFKIHKKTEMSDLRFRPIIQIYLFNNLRFNCGI